MSHVCHPALGYSEEGDRHKSDLMACHITIKNDTEMTPIPLLIPTAIDITSSLPLHPTETSDEDE